MEKVRSVISGCSLFYRRELWASKSTGAPIELRASKSAGAKGDDVPKIYWFVHLLHSSKLQSIWHVFDLMFPACPHVYWVFGCCRIVQFKTWSSHQAIS